MVRRRKSLALKIRLYPGQDDDLLEWLEEFEDQPYGVRTQALKSALRRGSGVKADLPTVPVQPELDLAEVRRVVEAAVTSVLIRFTGQGVGTGVGLPPEEDDETEDLLSALGATLVLDASAIEGEPT
jgi:hypothetical protein